LVTSPAANQPTRYSIVRSACRYRHPKPPTVTRPGLKAPIIASRRDPARRRLELEITSTLRPGTERAKTQAVDRRSGLPLGRS
jgi:hypothetical protein